APFGDHAREHVALGEDADEMTKIVDHRDAADVLVAHCAGDAADVVLRIDVKERTTFDDFGDLLHTGSLPGAIFGFSARFPSPSYAAYLYASPRVGKLKTQSMNALIVPPNVIAIIPMCSKSEALSPTMCTPRSF